MFFLVKLTSLSILDDQGDDEYTDNAGTDSDDEQTRDEPDFFEMLEHLLSLVKFVPPSVQMFLEKYVILLFSFTGV